MILRFILISVGGFDPNGNGENCYKHQVAALADDILLVEQ